MLSLVGSIQPDPFSKDHVPDHSIISTTAPRRRAPQSQLQAEAEMDAEEDDAEEDAFELLGRKGDEAEAKEHARTDAEEAEKKERKRKRKEEKAAVKGGAGAVEKRRKKTS